MKLKKYFQVIGVTLLTGATVLPVLADEQVAPAPNGITLPEAYKDWRIISQSHRVDNNTVRIILGNDIAVEAARSDNIRPWPKGSILAKLVWKQKVEEFWPTAIAPDKFVHAEFMFKDEDKYKDTGGWGFARWLGMEQVPYGKDKDFVQECFGCHMPVKDRDYVFTTAAPLP